MSGKTILLSILTFIIFSIPFLAPGADNYLSHSIGAVILVASPEGAANALTVWADKEGGYYFYKSKDRVSLRVPYRKMGELRSYIESIAEEVIEIEIEAHDLREEVLRLRSGLEAREEILTKNLRTIQTVWSMNGSCLTAIPITSTSPR
jgi:hypothetical protein